MIAVIRDDQRLGHYGMLVAHPDLYIGDRDAVPTLTAG
jgi:hypothetical protein